MRSCLLPICVATWLLGSASGACQSVAAQDAVSQDAVSQDAVAARLIWPDGTTAEVTASDVAVHVRQAARGRKIAPEGQAYVQAQALEFVIHRKLILRALASEELAAGAEELTTERESQTAALARQGVAWDDHLKERQLTLTQWEEQTAFTIGWKRFLDRELTDEALEAFFQRRPRDFDGTEIRVRHVLLRDSASPEPAGGDDPWPELVQRATALRAEIMAGKLAFEEAAARYSAGPSRRQGGDLGFIPRHERMVEAFSRAAFALEPEEISPPVVTPFGVHLIQCTEIRPGKLAWSDVREPLTAALTEALFAERSSQERSQAKIEYLGTMPYMQPETGRLFIPPTKDESP